MFPECPVLDSSCSSHPDTLSMSSETDEGAGPSSKKPRFDEAFEAKQFVNSILEDKAGGHVILAEYKEHGKLTDSTRRLLVNIVVAYITDKEGRVPSKETKTRCALGIVTLFPALKDPYSKTGYGGTVTCPLFYSWLSFCHLQLVVETNPQRSASGRQWTILCSFTSLAAV
ncbi:uncharacterized protein LOC125265811 isoform X2 [Megalobrama amblycephala]|uniref:uncharacterized protein LOC125265811 isoform X2 n=1 Tax=Megalobrama amblycephala TaxID=75352 RepID=UPI0020143F73|nr:uncharacterized protein LOC125265811 isoform X2 [Megalobrama amblycephala]